MDRNNQKQMPLRYRISDFRQLNQCMSNNSRHLHIVVTTFINDKNLNGLRIKLDHDKYGTLFACILDAQGDMISRNADETLNQLTPGQILSELWKYGFIIEYDPIESMPGNQLEFLENLYNFSHMDKIRVMSVWEAPLGVKEFNTHIVAFQSSYHGDWLNAGYSPSKKEYLEGLENGSAIDVSRMSRDAHYDWSWLYGWVGNISDILEEHTGTGK